MSAARAFRVLRAASGLRQVELAARMEIDPSYLSLLEHGRRSPTRRVVDKLCGALQVPKRTYRILEDDDDDYWGGDLCMLVLSDLRRLEARQ